ncbi:hypothetical protein HT745_16655 [Pseudosulfitobacter pseudonitzschiae]|uniref:hypothetical protein n=1 Tax=Pseudosulfitobacter pseudonitzschiae TaxID=1402135 RepID=UPI00158178DE|nr:hypothetical protein [Pseudosulfitobacter pseudonitzschiae]QKS10004.1 hypothetical protein HT745_16655 [Pseudosulfitobacter pseudonitzschiae]
MASLQDSVVKKFLETLSNDEKFDASKTQKLETLLKESRKIKADDLAEIFSLPDGGEVL